MCGRFTLRAPASVIAEQFGLLEVLAFAARFNIAPNAAGARRSRNRPVADRFLAAVGIGAFLGTGFGRRRAMDQRQG